MLKSLKQVKNIQDKITPPHISDASLMCGGFYVLFFGNRFGILCLGFGLRGG